MPRAASKSVAFERRFNTAARRVLKRRGVPESRIDAEIERLRQIAPSFDIPSVEELEKKLSELAKPR